MITRPIIPVWIMIIICIILIIAIVANKKLFNKINADEKTTRQKGLKKQYFIDVAIKVLIIVILFVMNLRFMIPNGDTTTITSNLNILFVIDTTVSMSALDYNGNSERMEGVRADCEYIIDELGAGRYSVISFNDEAKKVIPFTTDAIMAKTTIKTLRLPDSTYAKGSSLNIVRDVIKKTIEDESKRRNGDAEFVVFFISDGEITKEEEKLESFAELKTGIINGAVLGYGTTSGGRMKESLYYDDNSTLYLKYHDPQTFEESDAISRIDENNLKKIALDLGIDYIKMDKKSDIDSKIKSVKEDLAKSKGETKKETTYRDTYYYLAVPLVLLFILELVIQKRKLF